MSSNLTTSTIRKDKPIGGGHSFENCSELTTRVGSTPTPSAIFGDIVYLAKTVVLHTTERSASLRISTKGIVVQR